VPAALSWTSEFTLANVAYYSKYRLYITSWVRTDDNFAIYELELLGETNLVLFPQATFNFNPEPITGLLGKFVSLPSANLFFSPTALGYGIGDLTPVLPPPVFPFAPLALSQKIEPRSDIPSTIIYRVRLTGAKDGLEDVELPISSYQARLRNNKPTYLSVVVPDGKSYAGMVAARQNGSIVIERGIKYQSGEVQYVELMRVDLENSSDGGGGRNRSLTLSGHATIDHGTPKSIELSNVRIRTNSASGLRFRAELDLNLRPGDTAVVGAESFTVGLITYIVSSGGEMMEVSE
jgi:hypothetical protein